MDKIANLIVAAGEHSADMRYASGFAAPDPCVYWQCGETRLLIVSALEHDRAVSQAAPGVRVADAGEFGGPRADYVEQALAAARAHGVSGFRVPADFPLLLADRLRGAGMTVAAEPGPFLPEREFKRDAEIAEITRALRLAESAVREACNVLADAEIGPGRVLRYGGEILTSEALRRVIDLALAAGGGQGIGTIAAGGRQAAAPHHAGSGPLYADAPIVMDVFPRLLDSGYWGDLTRTVVKGRPSAVVARAWEAVRTVRDRAKTRIRPGADPAAIHEAARRELEEAGFPTGVDAAGCHYGFFHGLGHGVGLEIHEAPRLAPRAVSPLRGGEVITVEPGLYDPAWGGVRLEDMVVVRPDGAECLTRLEDLPVID